MQNCYCYKIRRKKEQYKPLDSLGNDYCAQTFMCIVTIGTLFSFILIWSVHVISSC